MKKQLLTGVFAALIAALTPGLAQADTAGHPVVLELFTSQGCSSCPPADRLLATLADKPGILALSYHVTYWNKLGWVDPLSFDAMTRRQYGYAAADGKTSVYTPQLVVQGDADVNGANSGAVNSALEKAQQSGTWIPLTVARTGGKVTITAAAQTGIEAELLLVGYIKHTQNSIPAGENAGTQGIHRNSVIAVKPLGAWQGGALNLSEDAPQGDGIAVIAQRPGSGAILGAGWVE